MKFLVFILVLFFSINLFPQDLSTEQLDSLYSVFTFIKGVNTNDELQKQLTENNIIIKCGLSLVGSIKQNLNLFSADQQNILSKLLAQPTAQKSVVSPNGFFRVHYDTSGSNAIGYNINLFLQALDSVYNYEIIYLGYPAPPPDGTEGDDDKYDIYIQNLYNTYGYTTPGANVGTSQWTSFINIDNDFGSGFYTHGIDAARVTAAHEFHHAIQMGNYAPIDPPAAYRNNDVWFYEITSTSFEEFVFDDVNDYYAYMPAYFNNPEQPLQNTDLGGYDIAIWNIFLQKKFDHGILKKQWEMMPANRAIKSIALSFSDYTTTFGNELNRFGIWCYFTGSRNVFPGEYFDEADQYPELNPTATMNFNSNSQTYNMSVNPTANYFFNINLVQSGDKYFTIITNSDWQKAITDVNELQNFSLILYNDSSSGNKYLNENYSVTFNKENQTYWNSAGILNNIVVYGDTSYNIPEMESETFAYPNPYRTSTLNKVRIALASDLNKGDEVDLNIYTSGLEQVLSKRYSIVSSYLKSGKKYCEIILDNTDLHFSSGVYIYAIKSGKELWKGKLVIFND